MTRILYWLVYHFDLGPLGPKVLDYAVQSWLKRAKERELQPLVRRRAAGAATVFHLQPSFGGDERM
jgi:hypothetical protein